MRGPEVASGCSAYILGFISLDNVFRFDEF